MDITLLPLPVKTRRLTLRRFVADDFPSYADYHSRPEVYQYLYTCPPEGNALQEQFDNTLGGAFDKDGDALYLAVVNESEDIVGEVLLKLASKEACQAEVGYIFHPGFAGRGYATEAVSAMIDLGFNDLGFHRIFARLDTQNQGSVGVVERLGLRREAHLMENDLFNGVWGDEYIYATLAREWNREGRGDPQPSDLE